MAFFWLLHASVNAQTTPDITDNLASLLYYSINFVESLASSIEDYPDIEVLITEPPDSGVDSWAEFSTQLFVKCSIHAPDNVVILNGFKDAAKLLHQLTIFPFADPAEEPNTRPSKSVQRGAGLSERERLNAHHNAFQPQEAKLLANILRSSLEHHGSHHPHRYFFPPQSFFEGLIATLALATGRTIRGALDFSLSPDSSEFISFHLMPGYKGQFQYPFWNRSLSEKYTLKIPLPEFLMCLAHEPIRFNSARTIEECLPFSTIDWEQRCLDWLQTVTHTPKHKLDRRIRDALARALYQDTACPALLDWITSPLEKLHKYPEPQTYYLNPLASRTFSAYSYACTSIFGKYGANKYSQFGLSNLDWGITTSEQEQIVVFLQGKLHDAQASGDPVEYHNAFAKLVLLALVVATGHRKSSTPFFFPWDIVHTENLAFVCDKLTVGSEARFVPIPEWLSKLVRAYWLHLNTLSKKLEKSNPEFAGQIDRLFAHHPTSQTSRKGFDSKGKNGQLPPFGQFFLIDKYFSARAISTRDLEKSYTSICTKGIGNFRKSIANSLWLKGLSGYQIEAFLGHNSKMHCFGESSAWTMLDWAKTIRDTQEKYMIKGGWQNIYTPSISESAQLFECAIPHISKSQYGYEGRDLDNRAALNQARRAVSELLPAEWFNHDEAEITETDVAILNAAVKERLVEDIPAYNKVSQAMAELVRQLRAIHGTGISLAIANLTRIDPGPICASSSRYYSIASITRDWCINILGKYSSGSDENYLDRLAIIGVSLIVFDAVLDKTIWELALNAIATNDISITDGCVHLRLEVEKYTRAFTKSVILTPITAAQIIGLKNTKNNSQAKPQIKDLTRRIEKLLKNAPYSGKSLSVPQLFLVFKSWWMIRISGSEFSIAIGDHSGPAPDEMSECALYGIKTDNDYTTLPARTILKTNSAANIAPAYAKRMINELLSDARGSFELKQQTSKRQRNELFCLLSDSIEYFDLMALASQQPIVAAMLGLLQHLLEQGGKRVKVYKFSSLATYYSHVNKLIEVFWDRTLDDLKTEEFDIAYLKLISHSKQAGYPIFIFHKYLQETYDVPPSKVANSIERVVIHCRSAVITMDQFIKAWEETDSFEDDGQIILHTKTFLGIGYGYGLRAREILGLESDHIQGPRPVRVLVEKNNVRDLKTKKYSLRIAHPIVAISKCQKHIEATSLLSAAAPSNNHSIFANDLERHALYPKFKITQATTNALRSATGNQAVVPHIMRHSAATRFTHYAIPSPRTIPLSDAVDQALSGGIDTSSIYSLFGQGFNVWPFWTDRIGMFLGHSGVDTLLNTYWHTSHLHLAARTWKASENISLAIQHMSGMLGKDRTTISKQLTNIRNKSSDDSEPNIEALVAYHLRASRIPKGFTDELSPPSPTQADDELFHDKNDREYGNKWVAFDRLLCLRLRNRLRNL